MIADSVGYGTSTPSREMWIVIYDDRRLINLQLASQALSVGATIPDMADSIT